VLTSGDRGCDHAGAPATGCCNGSHLWPVGHGGRNAARKGTVPEAPRALVS
jgi:hypothetical protein